MNQPQALLRLRITYAKSGPQRYIGHLDLLRTWVRALRRAGIPVAYTQGFHPQPRIHLACALPLGFASLGEVMDVWVEHSQNPDYCVKLTEDPAGILPAGILSAGLSSIIQQTLPAGLQITDIEPVDLKAPALQTQVWAAGYRVELTEPVEWNDLSRRVTALLETPALIRQRRGKSYDLRPLILGLRVTKEPIEPVPVALTMQLQAREGATGRPEEVVDCLGINPTTVRILRTQLYM